MKKFMINLGLLVLTVVALVAWTKLPWIGVVVLVVVFALWMLLTRSGRQASSVTMVGVSTLRQRLGSSSVIVIGIAGVVGVLIALLAMGTGLQATMQSGGRDDTAIVMRGGVARNRSRPRFWFAVILMPSIRHRVPRVAQTASR